MGAGVGPPGPGELPAQFGAHVGSGGGGVARLGCVQGRLDRYLPTRMGVDPGLAGTVRRHAGNFAAWSVFRPQAAALRNDIIRYAFGFCRPRRSGAQRGKRGRIG